MTYKDEDDLGTIYKKSKIQHMKDVAYNKAHSDWKNGQTPLDLITEMARTLNLDDIDDRHDLAARLNRQAVTLDAVFFKSLNQAGLTNRCDLASDSLKNALHAQKQCRQVFDSLDKSDFRKQTIEARKDQEKQ